MAERSIRYNGLDNRIHMVNDDVIGIAAKIGYEIYDTVTCNPPYFPAEGASEKNLLEHVAIARHEIHLTLEQAIQSASELLKQGGKAAFVHRPGRLLDIVTACVPIDWSRNEFGLFIRRKGKKRIRYSSKD